PAVVSYRPLEGVLVDRSAYREADPVVGDRVWVTGQPGHGPGTAVVVAVPGQAVERLDDQYRVAGRGDWYFPRAEGRRASFELSVPEGHLLVAFEAGGGPGPPTAPPARGGPASGPGGGGGGAARRPPPRGRPGGPG